LRLSFEIGKNKIVSKAATMKLAIENGDALYHGDCLEIMRQLPDGACDLIYIDPPFWTGSRRVSARSPRGYDDRWSPDFNDYLTFLDPRFREMRRLLTDRGSLYVHLDWRAVHYVKILLDEIFGRNHFLNEIIWSYRTGGQSRRWFARKHDTILLYGKKRGRHIFQVQRDGVFRTDGLNRDDEGRIYKSTKSGRLYFHADGPAMTDVWAIPFLSTVSKERTGYPTQKPMALLRRIILASSKPESVVGDFFCGSGTTPAVAAELGRRWIACDIELEAVDICRRRMGLSRDP
jgi:DNA modification methylase